MTTLNRLVIPWQGPMVKGAAVTVLHWSGAEGDAPPVGAVVSAFNAVKTMFPLGLSWTIPGSGDKIEDTTGDLAGVWTATGGATVSATGSASCAAGVGACIGWTTGGIVSGTKGPRKLRGRMFLVPLTYGVYDGDGTIEPGALGNLRTFANSLQAAGPLAVWHRPSSSTASDGNSYGVISNSVRDKVAFLSSRRD